jgi:ankyrin repeat protein
MATVLRGKPVEEMEKFFCENSSREAFMNAYVQSNPTVLQLWLQQLREQPNPASDNEPLAWIKEMLQTNRGARPTAFKLMDMITKAEGDFTGVCCTDADDGTSDDSSYAGSITDEGISSDETATQLLHTQGFDTYGWSFDLDYALQWAAGAGQTAIIRLLLKRGANVKTTARDGWTALHSAASKGYVDVSRMLIDAGADIDADADGAGTPLHWAAKSGSLSVAKTLLKKGAAVGAKTDNEWIPLHSAAKSGHENVARLLISKGSDVTAVDKYGQTPLHIAAREGHSEVIVLLIEKGANTAAKDRNSRTALQWAKDSSQSTAVKILSTQL